jgi:hypothetical protein
MCRSGRTRRKKTREGLKILDDFITADVPLRQTVAELKPKID